jgi:hypothetical protein
VFTLPRARPPSDTAGRAIAGRDTSRAAPPDSAARPPIDTLAPEAADTGVVASVPTNPPRPLRRIGVLGALLLIIILLRR